jgi:GDP-4-dehydro-6-deoxy-D-mannose reductase
MRILVTGVSGFVGRHLAPALATAGHEVHGLGVQPPHAELPLASSRIADLTRIGDLEAAFAAVAPDAIVNLAGQASAAHSFADPAETFRVNTAGALTLLEAVRRTSPRVRVLLVGSGEVYGPQPAGTRVAESAPFGPLSPYALSKAAADLGGAAFAEAHGLDVVRTRSFAHAGPGQDERFVLPSFAKQIAHLERGTDEPVLRVGNLDVVRDLSDVRDVVAAYVALLERGARGAAYNVCRGEGVKLTDVAARMVARARRPLRIEVDPARMRPADVPYLVGDPTALAAATGLAPAYPLDRTLDDVIEFWRSRDS